MHPNLIVRQRVIKSSEAFSRYVLPVLFSPQDRSRFVSVEGGTDSVSKLLDYAGIDWFWRGPKGLTAVSQRTQTIRRGQRPFDTFTVRVSLLNGCDTELQKLTNAVNSKGEILTSYVTIQSYLSEDNQLLSSGRMRTLDLAKALISAPRRWPHLTNYEDGTKFVGPTWAWLQSERRPVKIWTPPLALAA